jgi:hypothetical protein
VYNNGVLFYSAHITLQDMAIFENAGTFLIVFKHKYLHFEEVMTIQGGSFECQYTIGNYAPYFQLSDTLYVYLSKSEFTVISF